MTLAVDTEGAAPGRDAGDGVPNGATLDELSDRLDRLTVTLRGWRQTIDAIIDLRTDAAPTGDKPAAAHLDDHEHRLSRYERRTARLPRLGDNASGINSQIHRLRIDADSS